MDNNKVVIEGILSKGYGISPKLVMRDKRLTIEAKAIYAYISSFAGNGSSSFPGIEKMCKELGTSEKRFRKHRDLLVEFGYIEIQKRKGEAGKFDSNLYVIKQNIEFSVDSTVRSNRHDGVSPSRQNDMTINNSSLNNNSNINNNSIKTSRQKFETSDMDNAKLLFKMMKDNNPNVKEPNFEKWANEFRLMRERDGRTDNHIKYMINWCQKDSFWYKNILSPDKLRKQWDRLVLAAKDDHEKKQKTSYQATAGSFRFSEMAQGQQQINKWGIEG